MVERSANTDVFRSVLDGIPLICRTPPAFVGIPPVPTNPGTGTNASSNIVWATPVIREPVPFFLVFIRMPGFFCGPGRVDDQRYAAHAALRFTAEELDAQIEACVTYGGAPSRETFKPLVSYRLAFELAQQ